METNFCRQECEGQGSKCGYHFLRFCVRWTINALLERSECKILILEVKGTHPPCERSIFNCKNFTKSHKSVPNKPIMDRKNVESENVVASFWNTTPLQSLATRMPSKIKVFAAQKPVSWQQMSTTNLS